MSSPELPLLNTSLLPCSKPTFKILQNLAPSYLCHIYTRSRTLRSSSAIQLFAPSANLTTMGSRAFSQSAPRLWNSLPPDLYTSDTVSNFNPAWKCTYSEWHTLSHTNYIITFLSKCAKLQNFHINITWFTLFDILLLCYICHVKCPLNKVHYYYHYHYYYQSIINTSN